MKICLSPNFNERAPGIPLSYIVIHYTGMKDGASALAWMCDKLSQVSAHYMIDEDGTVTQLVPEEKRAWHAGHSLWRGITDLNSASIGIELVNPGHEFGYRPFPAAQVIALKQLLRDIIARHKLDPATALLAHSDIAPARKQDPGELFPWQELARDGLGQWPTATNFAAANKTEIIDLLKAIGYDTRATRDAVLAFQRRYDPENVTGVVDMNTAARLRAVASFG